MKKNRQKECCPASMPCFEHLFAKKKDRKVTMTKRGLKTTRKP